MFFACRNDRIYWFYLQMSKALVEMQIENNKIKEEAEVAKFELTNKVHSKVS